MMIANGAHIATAQEMPTRLMKIVAYENLNFDEKRGVL